MLHLKSVSSIPALLLAALACCTVFRADAQTIVLGSAASFAVLGDATVTNTGTTTVFGDLGVSPSGTIVGFPPGLVSGGTIYLNDATSALAQTDATSAYNQLAGSTTTLDLSGTNLGERTLFAGVYAYTSNAGMNGVLTLDGGGQADAQFIFKITSDLTTTSTSSFNLINGASTGNIWFQVGTSATLETNSAFAGTLIASQSITLKTGALVTGRLHALNGAVTLDSNTINNPAVPEPATYALIVSSLALMLAVVGNRHRKDQAA